jgi:uncharacterized membrane protein YhaH (DUF805 family)
LEWASESLRIQQRSRRVATPVVRAIEQGVLMGFDDAVKLGFSNYVNFSGRACRSEYWYWVLFGFIGGAACEGFDVRFGTSPFIAYIFFMATFLPLVSVGIRRLHDLDRSGWWYLLFLIPLVGWIILIFWFCTKGTDGPNRFGADRLAAPIS